MTALKTETMEEHHKLFATITSNLKPHTHTHTYTHTHTHTQNTQIGL